MCTPASAFGNMLLLAAVAVVLICSAAAEPAFEASAAAATRRGGSGTDVYFLPDGQDYRGRMNVTESGIPCQVRSSQTPHTHQIALDPVTGAGHHNYCRNANGLQRPGCFATTPDGDYQFCEVEAVCTAGPFLKPMVQFWPVSGTKMAADGGSNYVTLRCDPPPCRIHYVLGAEASASAASPVYAQPLLLEESTTVKTYVMYDEAEPIRAQARYTVTTTATAAPTRSIQFTPSDAVVYNCPIFVVLQGITSNSHVRLYWDDDFMSATTYTGGALRLTKSTKIVAVVNSAYLVSASFKIDITAPRLNVYPPSGTYVGGVAVLVNDPQPPATYYMYVNRSTNWEPLSTLLFPWTAIGTSELDIRALHLKGIESAQTVVYEVVPALPPTISPDPSVVHHRPVNVTCTAPLGVPAALSVYRDAAMQDAVVEEVYSVLLSAPGAYTVMCTYADRVQATHATTAVLQLVAVPMQPPTFTPACGAGFPAIALSLQVELKMSNLRPGSLATSWFVLAAATGGARIPTIARSFDAENVFVYDLFQSKPIQVPTTVEVHVTAHSLDPIESDSPRATCAYSLYPRGMSPAAYFSAIADGATASAPVSPSCIMTLKQQLASCLYFNSTELLSMHPFGLIVAVRMTGLAAAIQSDMHTRMGACLADMQRRGVLSNVRNEASGEMVLATSWHVSTPTPMAAQVYTGLPTTVQVTGFHADAGEYHLVRHDHSCEDIGLLPEAAHEASRYATEVTGSLPVQPSTDGSTYLTFWVPIAGQYKLCSYISDTLYEVPFKSSSGGAATAAGSQYLDVVAQPWRTLAAKPAEECGGLVPSDMEDIAFSLSMAAVPAGAFASLAYAHNGAEWASVPFLIDAETKLGGAASASIGPLNRYTRPLEVFDASLGPTAGAAQTCVFFVSAADSSVQQEITYFFYKMNASEVPANLTGVMLLLQGRFQPGELIVIDVYENVTSAWDAGAVSSSLHLLRRVTARASVATAYGVALPDSVLGLPAGEQDASYLIHATLDGVSVAAAPSMVALSPLALAMTSCTACSSKLCHQGQCLCKNKDTKAVFVCGTDSSDTGESQGHHTGDSSASSSFEDGEGGHAKSVSLGKRLMFLFAYLGLLAAIASYIFISIKRGGSRRGRGPNAEDIAVHNT
ncbi:hypothetical protein LSCM4_04390 [Leishmania orientalis]|uniref:Kringle domain-containing protein n=1 Tax=Leishmania orientalis TaxID=2249476 RepID=A0A836KT15_9TRYP|nr:hypothetical protein LSCM4_04390 [Leishmania orientalis]